jgi:hypothetical protein
VIGLAPGDVSGGSSSHASGAHLTTVPPVRRGEGRLQSRDSRRGSLTWPLTWPWPWPTATTTQCSAWVQACSWKGASSCRLPRFRSACRRTTEQCPLLTLRPPRPANLRPPRPAQLWPLLPGPPGRRLG